MSSTASSAFRGQFNVQTIYTYYRKLIIRNLIPLLIELWPRMPVDCELTRWTNKSESRLSYTRPSREGQGRTLWQNLGEVGATNFLWQEIIPREESQTNQGSPSREKSQSRIENNGVLPAHFPPLPTFHVECQYFLFIGQIFSFYQFVFIYSVPEDAVDIMKCMNMKEYIEHKYQFYKLVLLKFLFPKCCW